MSSQNVDPAVSRATERSTKGMNSSNSVAVDGHAVTKRLQQDLMTLMVRSHFLRTRLCTIRPIVFKGFELLGLAEGKIAHSYAYKHLRNTPTVQYVRPTFINFLFPVPERTFN